MLMSSQVRVLPCVSDQGQGHFTFFPPMSDPQIGVFLPRAVHPFVDLLKQAF